MKIQPSSRSSSAEIPTSSLADVAFLLVIYFMLATTFAVCRGLDFDISEGPPDPPRIDPVEAVLVEVQPGGALQVDRRPMELEELLPYLAPKLERNPDKPVLVRTASTAPYGAMVTVLDELRQGKQRLGLERDVVISIPTEREIQQFW